MARSRARRILIGIAVVVLIATVLPFVNVSRFKGNITPAIEQALGRRVTVKNLSLRLLPRPGLNLEGFVVFDADEFGAEPMLRADEVTAYLRLSSLWHGRLEIAQLSLKYPSLNLVRSREGRWNIEALLQRASQTPSAPTAKTKPEARPRFPYIEAEDGRINLKLGQEKKVYALSEADFGLWLSSENEWTMRLRARPVRTDTSVTDTGTVRVNGKFERARNLRETRLDFRLALERAQLGSITKLIYGRDRGWRGGVEVNAALTGSPGALKIAAEGAVADFRRFDVATGQALRLRTRCLASYSTATGKLSEIECTAPLGTGQVLARGSLQSTRDYDLNLTATKLPAGTLLALAKRAKQGMAEDLSATGDVDAALKLRSVAGQASWSGSGRTSTMQLESAGLRPAVMLGPIQFVLGTPSIPGPHGTLVVKPFSIALGADDPASARAAISATQYALELQGHSQARRLLQLAQVIGLRAIPANLAGVVNMDLRLSGKWAGFAAPLPTGTLQLRNVKMEIPGVSAPVQFASGTLVLNERAARMQSMAVSLLNTHLSFKGWVEAPRGCVSVQDCPISFDLRADQLSSDELNAVLNPRMRKRPWYKLIVADSGPSLLPRLRGAGRLTANRVLFKSVRAGHVSAQVRLESGKLQLSELRGEVLGGRHSGAWTADFTSHPARWEFRGLIEHVAMDRLATLMRDNWAGGAVDAKYRGTALGDSTADLVNSASGTVDFQWRDGVLRHVALNGDTGPLLLRRFVGRLELTEGVLALTQSRMDTPGGIYAVSGTASLGMKLGLKLARGNAPAFTIGGTLQKPLVTAVAQHEAKLP
jgi:AsmA protein